MKKFLRIVFVLVSAAAAFLLLLMGATQTQFFRDRLRTVVRTQLDSLFAAEVVLGQIHGNLVSGFSIDSVALYQGDLPAIAIDRIDLRYNLFDIPGRAISISDLTLIRPQFRLLRGMDSVWNTSRLLRPGPEDTLPGKPFDWPVALNRLEIRDGTFVVADSLVIRENPPRDAQHERLHDFTVRHIDLLLSAHVAPKEKHVVISRLSAACQSPDITLRLLSGDFTVTPTESKVRGLRIVTGRSTLDLTAVLGRFDLFGGLDLAGLEHCPVSLQLGASPIDLNELQMLLPPLDFLNGRTGLALAASGEFGHLNISQLDLAFDQSHMRLKGLIGNLHRPGDLTLAVKLNDASIEPGDLLKLMPPFNLPDFSSLGATTLAMEFDGKPLDFRTRLTLGTSAGTVNTDLTLRIGGPPTLRYHGSLTGRGLNPARILQNGDLEGNLNGTATFDGEGVSLERLASTLDIQLDPSEFRGLPVPSSHLKIDAAGRVFSAQGSLGLGEMTATLSARLDQREPAQPRFAVDADVAALNLAPLLHNKEYDSDLTLHLRSRGQGLTLGTLGGEAVLDLSSSRYRQYRIANGDIRLLLDQSDPRARQLQLFSNMADFSLTGAFNLGHLIRLIGFEAQNVRLAVGRQFASIDTAMAASVDPVALAALGQSLATVRDSIDARYSLQIKDLEPVSVVAGDQRFQGQGLLKGSVRGSYQDLSLHGLLDARYFVYGNVERGVLLQNAQLGYDLTQLRPLNPLRTASLRLNVDAEKLHINHTTLDSLALDFQYADAFARYALQTVSNTDALIALRGTARTADSGLTAGFEKLQFGYRDFLWAADSGATFTVSGAGAAIRQAVFRHDTVSLAFDGSLGPDGTLDAAVTGRHLNLADLRYFLAPPGSPLRAAPEESPDQHDLFLGSADLDVTAAGTLQAPRLHALLRGRNISYKHVPFGPLDADLAYADSSLAVSVHGGSPTGGDTSGEALAITGTLPMDLAFAAVENRMPERPMDLTVVSTGTQMSILDPLLPTFNDLKGTMRCRLTVAGTPRHPQYGGTMSFEDCSFLFVPNNIQYTLNAAFQPNGERVRVVDAVIRNIPADEQPGRRGEITLGGDFAFRNFRPGDFNLSATGALQVVKETSHLSALSLYGNLFVETGVGGLHFTGNIDSSMLRGGLIVSNSNLVFPPTTASVEEESPLSIPLVFVNDTTSVGRAPVEPSGIASFFSTDSAGTGMSGRSIEASSRSFLDGMRYDLDIETAGGNTQIRMIFNAITNEELVAFIDGKFNITGDGRQWFGDLAVNRAYYNFFKRFNAEGNLHYRGSVLNPELDIKATYAGTRADTSGHGTENVAVTFKISGTRLEPKADVSMTINGEDYYQYRGLKSNDVQSDAIQFIVYGSFPLSASQRAEAGNNIGATVSSSILTGASSLLTGTLSEFLRQQTGFINSVEFSYAAGGTQHTLSESADIRLSGVAWSGIWRYGGKILDKPFSNANFSIQYSFGTILNKPSLRNLMFELERRVETNILSTTDELKQTNSLRLFYRFSF